MGKINQAKQQNPGQVDTTSPEAMANPDIMTAPSAAGGVAAARQAATAPNTDKLQGDEVAATPEEQEEYERAIAAVETVIYENEGTANAVADMLQPDDKIGSLVKAALLLIRQVDEQIDIDEVVIAELTVQVCDMLIEIAEEAKDMQFSEKELQAVLGSAWEGIMDMFGVDEESYAAATAGMTDDDISQYGQQYKDFLGE